MPTTISLTDERNAQGRASADSGSLGDRQERDDVELRSPPRQCAHRDQRVAADSSAGAERHRGPCGSPTEATLQRYGERLGRKLRDGTRPRLHRVRREGQAPVRRIGTARRSHRFSATQRSSARRADARMRRQSTVARGEMGIATVLGVAERPSATSRGIDPDVCELRRSRTLHRPSGTPSHLWIATANAEARERRHSSDH